jgi:hypothetical protein
MESSNNISKDIQELPPSAPSGVSPGVRGDQASYSADTVQRKAENATREEELQPQICCCITRPGEFQQEYNGSDLRLEESPGYSAEQKTFQQMLLASVRTGDDDGSLSDKEPPLQVGSSNAPSMATLDYMGELDKVRRRLPSDQGDNPLPALHETGPPAKRRAISAPKGASARPENMVVEGPCNPICSVGCNRIDEKKEEDDDVREDGSVHWPTSRRGEDDGTGEIGPYHLTTFYVWFPGSNGMYSIPGAVTVPSQDAEDFRSLSHLWLTSRWQGQRLAVLDVRGIGMPHVVGVAHVPSDARHGLMNLVSSFEIAIEANHPAQEEQWFHGAELAADGERVNDDTRPTTEK